MHTLILVALTLLAAQQAYTPTAASAPSTDIYLGRLVYDGAPNNTAEVVAIDGLLNITNRDGYDNQPAFQPDGTLLYASARSAEQTDVYRYDPADGTVRQATDTAASEFSPTPLPSGDGFSTIHEGPGVQALWRYAGDGTSLGGILQDVQPVGYHAWVDENVVVMFVLGGNATPATLQVGDLRTSSVDTVAENPGRSLHKVPGRRAVSFVRKIADGDWWIEVVDFGSGSGASPDSYTRLVPTLPGREDYAWTPGGTLLMGDGSKLFQARPGEDWVEIADLEQQGLRGITRIAVNADGTRIAIVGSR